METKKKRDALRQKILHGGIWLFILRIAGRGLGFLRIVILARLLSPEDFGLMGIAMLAISTLGTFSQTGFQAALVQKRGDIKPYLDTAWTMTVIRGCLLFSALFFAAPLIASFFDSPDAALVIRVVAISTLVGGLNNIGIVFFQKELAFDKKFKYEMSFTITDLAVSVALAFYLRNVWALVWGGLVAGFVRLLMSYRLNRYRPRFALCREKFLELFRFGKWVTGSGIVIFIATQGDDIVVGKIFGVAALGLYQMAYLISNMPATEITHVISQLTFPAYSKIHAGGESLGKAFMLTLSGVSALAFPIVALTILLAPEFIAIFLGEKWEAIIWPTRILAIAGGIRAVSAAWGSLYLALGRPKCALIKNTWRVLLTFLPMIVLGRLYGLNGIALSVLLGITAALAYDFFYLGMKHDIDMDAGTTAKLFFTYAAVLLPITIAGFLLKNCFDPNIYSFIFIAISFIAFYAASLECLSRLFVNFPFRGIRQMSIEMISK